MSDKDDQMLRRLLPIFREEAREHIAAIATTLSELERVPLAARPPLVETAFREAHSLKAAARAVGRREIERVCQSVESVFAALKRGALAPSPALLEALANAADALEDFLAAIDAAPEAPALARAAALAAVLDAMLERAVADVPEQPVARPTVPSLPPSMPAASDAPPPPTGLPRLPADVPPEPVVAGDAVLSHVGATPDTVRLSVQRLDTLLRQVEEMLAEKLAALELVTQLGEAVGLLSEWKTKIRNIRTAVPALHSGPDRAAANLSREAMRQINAFLEEGEEQMRGLAGNLAMTRKLADADARRLASKVDRLLYDMKQILTLPCGSLLQLFPRVVRDLARDQGKAVSLAISGADLQMDRHMLEELKEPLLHLVRNCVDHGIEKPEARAAAGKPAHASITLAVTAVEGGKIEFAIADDGAGIATEKLAVVAKKAGFLREETTPVDEAALLQLVFQSGVSTSPMITDVSGRGLGLAIVREKVERLGGTVAVETQRGRGTTFRLTVPLTLATYRGILVRLGERLFIVPTIGVERVVGVSRAAISTVENRPMLDIAKSLVPLVRLHDVLELPGPPPGAATRTRLTAIVLGTKTRRVAFEVDGIEGDHEILVKPLGRYLARVRNVQGASVLATGAIVPILNTDDLLKSAAKLGRAPVSAEAPRAAGEMQQKSVLLVEDSITARGLLKNILEMAGYRVTTAVDGMEAWTALNLDAFDLVVSDVEMPRMNGFELTARIRADKTLHDLPVVLVTALDSREDRERGVDVGANAYIVKGGFDQGRLIEAVRRLA